MLSKAKDLYSIFTSFLRRAGFGEFVVLSLFLLITGGIWILTELTDEVLEGETKRFDLWALQAMRTPGDLSDPLGPPWMEEMGRDVTALGGTAVLVFVTVAGGGFFWLAVKRKTALFVTSAVGAGFGLSQLFKGLFERPRPDVVPHLSHVYTSSFPSGHSMMAAVVYMALGSLIASVVTPWRLKVYVLSLSLLLIILVGVSRVYLGVHYPTDVLAGWTAGLVWAWMCWLVAHWLKHHRRIEERPLR